MRLKAKLLGTSQYQGQIDGKRVVLPISVSQLYHEGEKLIAAIELVKRKFSACDIVVADTLQRHNLLSEYPSKEAEEQAYQLGTEWIERNIHYIDNSPVPFNVIRWNECLSFPGYSIMLDKIQTEYKQNLFLQATSRQDFEILLERNKSLKSISLDSCLNYLFEEAAVITSYFVDKKYEFIIYPGSSPAFVRQCREIFVPEESSELIRNLEIYFKKLGKRLVA
jgi:tRNA-dependent cyclodipeptide synthase